MIRTLPLSLDAKAFTADHIVAYRLDGQPITWSEILQRLAFWQNELCGIQDEKVAIYHDDGIEFLCIVLTLWGMLKIPLVPANTLDSTLQALALETNSFVGEFPQQTFQSASELKAQASHVDKNEPSVSQQTALIMFTSGSSGAPAAVYKTFDQLNAELKMLEQHWGKSLQGTVTLGTVTHHHMFGLPFCLLWPLTSGRAFLTPNLIYLEQLSLVQQFELALISSPAHLEHIPETLDWQALQQSIRIVFSAGALLSESAAKDSQKKMGVAVIEVYGSTETGAIAHRNQLVAPEWQPLNGIMVKKTNGKLAVNSPTAIANNWFLTEDFCEVNSCNQFALLGRADKIIKVGGKRVSITAIEERLSGHPWVVKARVVLLEKRKNRVGAVIQLTGEANAKLVDQGKHAISRKLAAQLKECVEKVGWPRYWRFVSEIPVNQQGKTTAQALKALFDDEVRPRLPKILETSKDEESGEYIIQFVVPHDLFYLEGHFPGKPILPGVVQIGWAIHFFRELFGNAGDFMRLEALKFQQVIQPGERIYLSLMWDNAKNKLTFHYTSRDHTHASGRVFFAGTN